MSTDAEKVRAAADYIERVGLHKGQSFESAPVYVEGVVDYGPNLARGERCCTWGALRSHDVDPVVIETVADSILATFGSREYDITDWNDREERTADEVVTALRKAADTLEQGAPA